MTVLENILSQEIIQRLGWTLLHFIWQAMAVALLLAIMLRVMRKSTPSLRYILACLALGLIVLLPIVTMQLIPVSVPYSAVNIEPVPVHPLSPTVEIPVAETVVLDEPVQPEIVTPVSTESWKQRTVESLESALPYIVSGWLVGVFALSLWHLGGWAQLQRLRRKMVKQVDDTLHSKLKVLAQRLRVNQTVQLVESALVQIPTVVGWLRPVILLPASALTGLTSEQLEAILAHELAHIKRFDYLINILQTVVEILGFYHPAVWWVSHKIRAERENCCDDLAVSISGDRVCYARALTSMEEIRAGRGQLVRSGGLAVAATGGTLLERIRRLVGKDAAEKNSFSCVPAATVILLIIALAIPATITLTARAQGMPEGLGGAVIKGIRANRDKFECGYLAWSSKQITTRFADSNRPATELAGQYELWWDGKKIATKYVRDQVYKDPEGNFRVEKGQGGTSYDGGVLSWKPDFHSDNWLGPEFTRWRGLGSQDWLIQQDSKQASISREWSVVDTNGVKLIRFTVKNMNETDRDYGGYSIRDYDPSKGYGLVNEEWYNPNGSPRLKHTVKMLEVIPGGWFPVEVDFKSFTITDGRVYTHHHHALDIERCSFNDKSVLPARVFKGAVDKQLKYQEKLQKYLAMELRGISDVKEAAKADRVKHGAREAIEKFVAAAMAGDLEKAGKFAHPGKLPANQIADLNQIAKGQNLWIMAVVADDFDAIAVSSVIQGDHNRIGPLVFFLNREPQDGRDNWWVHDIDMETPDGAEAELKQFLEKHPKAEKIPSEKKPDVQVKGDILLGTLKVKDSSADNILTVLPTIAKSPPPSAEDKTIIQVDCLVVEVFTDLKMDRETTIVAENILGKEKVTTVPRGQGFISRSTTAALLLREAAEATAPKEDGSAGDKRVTQDQFKALVEMLASRGLMKILMNPRIQVLDGKTAKIMSTQKISSTQGSIEDSIQITPHVFEDGRITLQVEATISSKSIPKGIEQIPIVSKSEISTRVRTSSGESLIIGGLTEKDPAPGDNVKNSKKRTAEVLFILTPTIITPAADSQEKTDMQVKAKSAESADKLKQLGLAVIMYADDHDNKLPDTLEPLKPYIANEQDYLWLLDNVEYALKETETKYFSNRPNIPVAYDKTQKEKQSGANVLFLDGHVEFLTPQRLSELDIKRAKFLIETWFLAVNKDFIENINHNADSPDEAKELFKLKSELLAALDGSNKLSFIPSERNVSLLLKAVRAHKDSKVLAAPQVICQEDKTAKIKVMNNETYYIVGYTEPNSPSEKPQPKLEKVEEGIALSLRPNLTPNNNIDMQFEFQISKFLDSEERKFQGKAPYKPPKVQRTAQSLAYRVLNGQTLLFGGHKIADQQDGRTEQKDLLILIKAHTIGSSEQDKPAMVKYPIVTKPPRTTIDVITKPAIAKSRTERPEDNEQEQTKSATEQKPLMVQKIFKLKHHNSSQMGQIILPLVGEYGHISADERTNSLLVIDTAENLMRIEKIIAQFDVSKAEQTVTEIFEIRYGDPVEIVELLKKLINGPPGFGSIIEPGKEPIVLVPEPRRKWIIAKASPENIKQIGEWIKKLDISKSIGMDPADAAAYEQLETIVDLSDLAPEMSFGEVVDKLENSVEPPLQIQPIWIDLLENAEVEQATPAGMDPLSRIKLRKALEILIASVSFTELPKLTYIVDEGVILIGTVDMLLPKMVHRVYDISDLIENAADADALIRRITETIEPDSWYKLSNKGEGTIMAYPALQPKKFAVMQTYKIHQQITRFLEDTRSSRDELRKTKPEIMIETVFLSVSEDYLKDVGLDANTANFSNGWTRHLAAKYPAGPNGQPYGLIIDDLHVRFLLRTVQAHHDSKSLVAPRVRTRAGTTAEIGIIEEYRYIKGYNEPNSPSEEPQPKRDKVTLGPRIWLTPKLTDNNRNVNLDLKLEMRQLEGIIEGKYKGKYPYYKPIIDVISAKMPCTIPDGKIMLIGGLKINEHIKKEPGTGQMMKLLKETGALQLKDLPLIGAAFSSKDKAKDQKMLLILVKPVINPQQKATKLRSGQKDSEEQIRRLAEQLEKKLNHPAEPK